jgi:integrase
MKMTLTQSIVDSGLQCPEGRRKIEISDSDGVRNMFVECRAGCDDHTYYVRYRDPTGTTRLVRLGRTSQISLADARREAKKKKAEITLGADPAAERAAKRAVPLYSDFFERTYMPYVTLRKRSFKRDRQHYDLRIKAALGNLRLDQVTRQRIQALHSAALEEGLAASSANGIIRVIRYSLNLAIQWGLYSGPNQASRIPMFHEDNIVNNVPDDAELKRLLEVLRTDSNRSICEIALVLLNSAGRLSEILQLKWSDCDLEKRVFTIRASNSKSKRLRNVPINDTAMEVLQSLWTRGVHEFVFVNRKTGQPYKHVGKVWCRIRKRAGLPKLRIHDLRHAACSYMSASGVELWTIATIAGHSNPKITTRYSHVPSAALASAMDVVSKKVTGERSFTVVSTADQQMHFQQGSTLVE